MVDLFDMVTDENYKGYSEMNGDDDGEFMGTALGFAAMMTADQESIDDMADPADIFEDYEACLHELDLTTGGKAEVPAFEQYVYRVCGVS